MPFSSSEPPLSRPPPSAKSQTSALPPALRQCNRCMTLSVFISIVSVIVILYFLTVSLYVNGPSSFLPKFLMFLKPIHSFPHSAASNTSNSASAPSKQHVNDHEENDSLFNFSNVTTLNFMHLHKTGGTSIKHAFHKAYNKCTKQSTATTSSPAITTTTSSTVTVVAKGSCTRKSKQSCPSCSLFSCSWDHLLDTSESQRNLIDIAFGHQFLHGHASLPTLLSHRTVTSFTILRHPFARKFSMFFHFLVRNAGVDASDIPLSDITPYLLREQGRIKDKTRKKMDSGPNYYAGRLLSEGHQAYYYDEEMRHMWFRIEKEDASETVKKANGMLDSFAMAAVYEWARATQCVMKRMLQAFDDALRIERTEKTGIDGSRSSGSAADVFAEFMSGKKLNKGQYHDIRNSSSVWRGLSAAQQKEFVLHEWIDMRIYEHAVELFIAQVHRVGCEKQLQEDVDEMERGTGAGDGDFDGLLSNAVKRFRQFSSPIDTE